MQSLRRKYAKDIETVNKQFTELEEKTNSSTNKNFSERILIITKYIDLLNEDFDTEIELENKSENESDSDTDNIF
jgi:hypothetical protein